IRDEVSHTDRERAREAALQDSDVLLHSVEGLQRFFGVPPEPFAGGGQAEPPAGTFEQRDAKGLPERAELEAHRRLGRVQLARGLAQVAIAGDSDKRLKLMEGD